MRVLWWKKDRYVGRTGSSGCQLNPKMRYNDLLKATDV